MVRNKKGLRLNISLNYIIGKSNMW